MFYFKQKCTIYVNNIYITITPTRFDTFVSSSAGSKVVLHVSFVTLAKYNFGTPWGWYECVETCSRSDYNRNIVKIYIYCALLVVEI